MKKLFSFLAVVLLSISAMAGTVVFTAADFTGGAASPGAHTEASKSGVTVSTENGLVAGDHIRVFGGGTYTLNFSASSTMTKIEFEWAASGNKYDGPDTETPNATSFTVLATKQMRIAKITVTIDGAGGTTGGGTTGGGTTGGGTTGGGTTGGGTTLDPNYQYAEPTTVGVPTTQKAAGAQEFVENNIKVNISQGAIYADYFNCYAGQTITFTATQPIKGLTVNGFIKKEFTATTSAGQITYADALEDQVEADPVLVITDINNTSVTLTCTKQIRFYSIDFYFVENPDVEIGGGGDGEYSYDWEPTDPTTFNLTFDTLEVSDMTEYLGYKAVYLSLLSEDAELDMVAFADYDERTGIAVGTYPLNFSYEEGTVEASVGGDELYDYESYLMTNFQEYEGEWYYDPYYIVSGTLTVTSTGMTLNATSYFGSTITATYTFPAPTAIEQVSENDKAVKTVENSRLVIRRDGKRYNVLGARL